MSEDRARVVVAITLHAEDALEPKAAGASVAADLTGAAVAGPAGVLIVDQVEVLETGRPPA